jgi:NAD+ kinase
MEIALFGGAFNPPGQHHKAIVEKLREHFAHVVVFPSGSARPDKPTNTSHDIHRAEMCKQTFSDIPGVTLDLSDLENGTFTRTWQYEKRFASLGEVWLAMGSDQFVGGKNNESVIQEYWQRGEWLWRNGRFAVVIRPGYKVEAADFPPVHRIIQTTVNGSSTEIRKYIEEENTISNVTPATAEYISEHKLYGYHT